MLEREGGMGMRYVRLGKTELEVSAISFGTWAFGGEWGAFDKNEAIASIHRALDLGITLFDTAQAYGFGVSERLLGEALGTRRDDVIVATKGGLRMEADRLVRDDGRDWLRRGVESSLRNLGTDRLDLYQIHWPDPLTPGEETGAALEELVREGKIRHVGVSNYGVKEMEELAAAGRVETLQPPYDLFRHEIEDEILPYAQEHDIGVLVYGPLAHGLLSGHMTSETRFPADDWRSGSPDFHGETFARNLAVVGRLKEVAFDLALSLPELAVAWTLAHPAVQTAIVGAQSPSQLEGTVGAADVRLWPFDLDRIATITQDAVPVHGPSPEGM